MIRAARPFVVVCALAAVLFVAFGNPWLALTSITVGAALAMFFRDPERTIPGGDELIVSPADGRVVEVPAQPAANGGTVAIFLSLVDVHVNRSPVAGVVTGVRYTPGTFLPANRREAGIRNERNTLSLEGPVGKCEVSQIAGLVARRIHCYKQQGDTVERGERIGYIAFGSRTELTLPAGACVVVKVGDKVRGGETVIAKLPGGRCEG